MAIGHVYSTGPEPPTKRGTLNAGKTDISTYTTDTNLKQRQQWTTLDALGNRP